MHMKASTIQRQRFESKLSPSEGTTNPGHMVCFKVYDCKLRWKSEGFRSTLGIIENIVYSRLVN